MNIEEKIQLIEEGTLEVIDKEELKEVLKKDHPIAYTGYEPSGKIHLGHAVTVQKLKTLQKLGFKIKILLADYHAFLNGKGSVEEIAETAEYNKRCFQGLGLADDTEYILGSSFQTGSEYTNDVYQLATLTTLKRAKRSMDQVSSHIRCSGCDIHRGRNPRMEERQDMVQHHLPCGNSTRILLEIQPVRSGDRY